MEIKMDLNAGNVASGFGLTSERAHELSEKMQDIEKKYFEDTRGDNLYRSSEILNEFIKEANTLEELCVVCWRAGVSFGEYKSEDDPVKKLAGILALGKTLRDGKEGSDSSIDNKI